MRRERLKNILKCCIGFGAFFTVVFSLLPVPLYGSFPALEVKIDDPAYLAERTVSLSGTYYPNPFGQDIFRGTLQVSGYPITEFLLHDIQFGNDWTNTLWYSVDESPYHDVLFGLISSKKWLRDFVLLVYEDQVPNVNTPQINGRPRRGWSTDSGYCIVPNAATRDAALRRVKGQIDILHEPQ